MDPPRLGPVFCHPFLPATAMACIAVLIASATAWAIISQEFACSLAIMYHFALLMYAFVRPLLLTPCSVFHLNEDNTG